MIGVITPAGRVPGICARSRVTSSPPQAIKTRRALTSTVPCLCRTISVCDSPGSNAGNKPTTVAPKHTVIS
ncbi:MAG: hypothetical protein E6I32_01135 [Chloroflexi bacterium]|nr:MAG: hypothetical protein E6I32_01135 [Chloroflexota bacterium]